MSTSSSSRWVEVEVFVLDRWGWYSFRQSLHQAKEKIRDLEKDNVILRYALTVEWAQVILFMKGKQRETSELCLWHGERTEIHGMESWRNNKNYKIGIFSRQQRTRWRFRFLSLRQHWSRIWTTKAVWLRLLQGRGRLLLRWSRISRFLSKKTDLPIFPEHYIYRICKASSWQWRRTLKSRRTNCATLQKLELKKKRDCNQKKITTQDNSVDADELEAALAHMKQMQNQDLTAPPRYVFGVKICHYW